MAVCDRVLVALRGERRLKSKDRRIIQEAKELGGLRLEWFNAEG